MALFINILILSAFLVTKKVISQPLHVRGEFKGSVDPKLSEMYRNKTTGPLSASVKCDGELLSSNEVNFFENGTIFVKTYDKTVEPSGYIIANKTLCILRTNKQPNPELLSSPECSKKWIYEPEEFQILPNKSVLLYDEIIEEGSYEIDGDKLKLCMNDYEYDDDSISPNMSLPKDPTHRALIYVGRTGTAISIIALSLHLLVFFLVPTIRNSPGYNLASLSVAFLLAYCFVLVGQIPTVLGTSCIVSGSLQHFFFLVAFFWMNVISFDVWRALRLATHKLMAPSKKNKLLKFTLYAIYAWGIPLCLAVTAVVLDFSKSVPDTYKPGFGHDAVCWFTNEIAKAIFFAVPAFTMFIINTIFFILSIRMIFNNTMKEFDDQQRAARNNFILYTRLGVIMGVTWLIGIAGVIFKKRELWFLFDILNSLQGLFVFLLFTCSRKVWNHFKKQTDSTFGDSSKSGTFKVST